MQCYFILNSEDLIYLNLFENTYRAVWGKQVKHDVIVQYFSVIDKFIKNLQTSQRYIFRLLKHFAPISAILLS